MESTLTEASETTSVRLLLKNATASAHRRLDGLVGDRLLAGVDSAKYAQLLANLREFLATWEANAGGLLDKLLPGWVAGRSKLNWLQKDLDELGASQTAGNIVPVPPMASAGEALGAMYVIEGSTLGGRFIARKLRSARLPTAYFESYGEAVIPRWQEFVELLEEHVAPPDRARAVEAAMAMFDAMENVYAGSVPLVRSGGRQGEGEAGSSVDVVRHDQS